MILTGLFDDRFGTPGSFDIVRCRHCGLEQTWPRPLESKLKALYEQFYNFGGEQETTYTRARASFLNSALYRFWAKWEGDFSFHFRQGSGRLLDIGCNEGQGLTFYSRNGFQAEGLEINERAAAVAQQRGFTVHLGPLPEFSPSKPYAVIILANVLEHVPDPVATLSQVNQLLQPGGQVWISCPNADSHWRQRFGRTWINWHVPFHLWHFSPRTLQQVLELTNYRMTELTTCTPSQWLASSLLSKLAGRAGKVNRLLRSAPTVAALMLAAGGISPLLKPMNRRGEGDCLLAIAEKHD